MAHLRAGQLPQQSQSGASYRQVLMSNDGELCVARFCHFYRQPIVFPIEGALVRQEVLGCRLQPGAYQAHFYPHRYTQARLFFIAGAGNAASGPGMSRVRTTWLTACRCIPFANRGATNRGAAKASEGTGAQAQASATGDDGSAQDGKSGDQAGGRWPANVYRCVAVTYPEKSAIP